MDNAYLYIMCEMWTRQTLRPVFNQRGRGVDLRGLFPQIQTRNRRMSELQPCRP